MARPLILPLSDCTDREFVGGKAAGLADLLSSGFPVPPGLCVTMEAYERTLAAIGFQATTAWQRICAMPQPEREAALADCQARIRAADLSSLADHWRPLLQALPSTLSWAVRSSATNEDAGQNSFAGIYRTRLAVPSQAIDVAVKDLWASVWHASVVEYMLQRGLSSSPPAMAVVIQPMLDARTAGVAYSIHPVTGRSNQVMINAVYGLAAPLVDGRIVPDQYVVQTSDAGKPVRVRRRNIAHKTDRLRLAEGRLCSDPIPEEACQTSCLSDDEVFTVAEATKDIENALEYPVDVEWLFDAQQLWIVQARPITTVRPMPHLTNEDCEWTRANFKETMPDVPSPLGLSFLQYFMDRYILSHYRRFGCRIPEGVSSVRVLHGRPYLNVTLFHSLIGQLGGDPSHNAEQMGGVALLAPPTVKRLAWPALIRAGWLILREMRRGLRCGPAWFAEMKREAALSHPDCIKPLSLDELATHLNALAQSLDRHEVTFGIVAGVGQCLQTCSRLLPRWLGPDWRRLFNAALQGQGGVISAQQIVRLAELAQLGRQEPAAREWLLTDRSDLAAYRQALAGTQFLQAFEAFLADYGHRAVGESDIMSPRMAEQPESILAVLRIQARAPFASTASDLLNRQAQCRREALTEIRRRLGWRWDRWALFHWWYRRLSRFFALREANRHHLMYYSTALRHLLLRAGELLVAEGRIGEPEDIFFVTLEERTGLFTGESRDWKGLIASRRAERARQAVIQVADTIRDWDAAAEGIIDSSEPADHDLLRGLPISVGVVTGPARLVRSPADWDRLKAGDILVATVIDPGMAPIFGIAGGLIVEMGGTLSHGAIIAREYGLPTVANVRAAMTRIEEGQMLTMDAGAGTIRLEPHHS